MFHAPIAQSSTRKAVSEGSFTRWRWVSVLYKLQHYTGSFEKRYDWQTLVNTFAHSKTRLITMWSHWPTGLLIVIVFHIYSSWLSDICRCQVIRLMQSAALAGITSLMHRSAKISMTKIWHFTWWWLSTQQANRPNFWFFTIKMW